MARAKKSDEGEEFSEVTDTGEIPEVNLPPVSNEATVKADATSKAVPARSPTTEEKPATVRYFRVDRGGYILDRGYRTLMREGKVVDTLNYDPKRLASQGIKLTEIDADDRPGNFGSTFDL